MVYKPTITNLGGPVSCRSIRIHPGLKLWSTLDCRPPVFAAEDQMQQNRLVKQWAPLIFFWIWCGSNCNLAEIFFVMAPLSCCSSPRLGVNSHHYPAYRIPKVVRIHPQVPGKIPIWEFPEIGVPPNHPFKWIFPYKQTILGYPYLRKPPYVKSAYSFLSWSRATLNSFRAKNHRITRETGGTELKI